MTGLPPVGIAGGGLLVGLTAAVVGDGEAGESTAADVTVFSLGGGAVGKRKDQPESTGEMCDTDARYIRYTATGKIDKIIVNRTHILGSEEMPRGDYLHWRASQMLSSFPLACFPWLTAYKPITICRSSIC